MSAPVVFLDIDGVCNHRRLYAELSGKRGQTEPADWLDPACVARVDALCARTGAVVVISSSWREYLQTHERVAEVLASRGLTARVVDGTPRLIDMVALAAADPATAETRWTEVRAWLDAHPEVTRWVILDDCDWPGFPPARFVRTDIRVGITDDDAERAARVLESA